MRNFLQYPFGVYSGPLVSKGITYCGRRATVLPITVTWANYSFAGSSLGANVPNFAIRVSYGARGPGNLPDDWQAQSVWVDNEGVDFPVYIYFPDTQFSIPVAANSAGWFPLSSNDREFFIVAIGIPTSSVVANQETLVILSEFNMPPYIDYEQQTSLIQQLGSPVIQRSNILLPGIGSPALGDQLMSKTIGLVSGSPGTAIPEWGPFDAPFFLYITQLQITINAFTNTGASSSIVGVELRNSVDGIVYASTAYGGSNNGLNTGNPAIITDLRGNFRFNAQSSWTLVLATSVAVTNGQMNWNFAYTLNPR